MDLLDTLHRLKADVAEAIGRDAHISPEGFTGPCAIVYPRNPWVETMETWTESTINLGVQLVASPGTNAWVLNELAGLVDDLDANLPDDWVIKQISGPLVGNANGTQHQLLDIHISTTA